MNYDINQLPELLRSVAQNDFMIDTGFLPVGRIMNTAADMLDEAASTINGLRCMVESKDERIAELEARLSQTEDNFRQYARTRGRHTGA